MTDEELQAIQQLREPPTIGELIERGRANGWIADDGVGREITDELRTLPIYRAEKIAVTMKHGPGELVVFMAMWYGKALTFVHDPNDAFLTLAEDDTPKARN